MADTRDRWAAAVLADTGISHGCARTAWALREYANRHGRTTVGESRLARDTGQNKRTVERHIRKLKDLGYLIRTPGAGETTLGGTTTLTQFRLPDNAKVPAARPVSNNPKVPAARPVVPPKVPTTATESTGRNARKYRQSFVGQTINHIEPARVRVREGVARAALRQPRSMREIITDPATGLPIEWDDELEQRPRTKTANACATADDRFNELYALNRAQQGRDRSGHRDCPDSQDAHTGYLDVEYALIIPTPLNGSCDWQ